MEFFWLVVPSILNSNLTGNLCVPPVWCFPACRSLFKLISMLIVWSFISCFAPPFHFFFFLISSGCWISLSCTSEHLNSTCLLKLCIFSILKVKNLPLFFYPWVSVFSEYLLYFDRLFRWFGWVYRGHLPAECRSVLEPLRKTMTLWLVFCQEIDQNICGLHRWMR